MICIRVLHGHFSFDPMRRDGADTEAPATLGPSDLDASLTCLSAKHQSEAESRTHDPPVQIGSEGPAAGAPLACKKPPP